MSKVKLSFGQLNIAGALVGMIGALFTGFGANFVTVAGSALASGLPLDKALIQGAVAGGVSALTAAGNQVGGFLTQRTKGADGTAPVFPSLTSTDTASLGTATVSQIAETTVNPDYAQIVDAAGRIAARKLAELKESEATKVANAQEAAQLRARLAELEGTATTATTAGDSTEVTG